MKDLVEELQQKIKVQEQNKYPRQAKQVESLTEEVEGLYDNLKAVGAYLAGGAITSMFTNKEVNDLDIYFRSLESLKAFLLSVFGDFEGSELDEKEEYLDVVNLDSHQLICVGYTKKSIMFRTKHSAQEIQLIHCDFYETPEVIFDTFDYTINMGVYDFKEDMFVLDDDFLVDNSSRKLTVNPRTSFPIISQLRIDKYKQRGYSINRKEFIKLSLAVANLKLESWDDVKEAIGGMYGYTMEELFDEEKGFSFEELFVQLELLEYKLENQKPFEIVNDVHSLIEIIEDQHDTTPQEDKIYHYYKKVNKTDIEGVYTSHHDKSFTYKLGECVQCDKKGIFLYKSLAKAKEHYTGDTVIKLSTNTRAKLLPEFCGQKFSTNDKLFVESVVGEE